ncbi:MAG TPA: CpaD family pilus assembly lipoprotein [Stellaceae bacterium]|jgi:pilus assembly protein CpaD|nr:CpaD family pilus assembly lipoprotein [Stellaceae bacterium]
MKLHPLLAAGGIVLALAACRPGAAEYSEAEAPKNLIVDNASARIDVRFAGGSSRLVARDAAKLQTLVLNGSIAPSDRVVISASGTPGLAAARFNTLAAHLAQYGIIARAEPIANVAPNVAIIVTGRYLVTSPACPNWSKSGVLDFTNTLNSNYGCANMTNLARMVANPADLIEGRPVGLADAVPAASAVNRYEADKVVLPQASTLGPISTPTSAAPASVGGAAGSSQ